MGRKFRMSHPKNYERKKQSEVKKANPSIDIAPADLPSPVQPTLPSIQHLYSAMSPLTSGWIDQTELEEIKLCKLSSEQSTSAHPMVVSHSLIVYKNLTWKCYIHGQEIKSMALSTVPKILTPESFNLLIQKVNAFQVCPGNPDSNFMSMSDSRKGKFLSVAGKVNAYEDSQFEVIWNGERYHRTIRTSDCDMVATQGQGRCQSCSKYRSTLRAMYSRWTRSSQSSPKKYSNNRYLSTPQKAKKLEALQVRALSAEREVRILSEKILKATENNNVTVDKELHSYLHGVMESSNPNITANFPEGSFQRLFWDQQIKAARVSNARAMKWHPMMIRWCLNLKLLSSSCYHSLRTAGFVKLPSERTLRDYTHYVKARSGFQKDVEEDVVKEAKLDELPEWKRHIVLIMDEMKIKESLVYDKVGTKVIGFIDIGNVNNQLNDLEDTCRSETLEDHHPVATHMFVLMIRGIFITLAYPYAHFATSHLTGASLFTIVWEAIERLEMLGFKVLVVTGDGASSNRRFFKLHSTSGDKACHKTTNPYDPSRQVFFMSDVPHLLKTVRNCWSHSDAHGCQRNLWIHDQEISWKHLIELYDAKMASSTNSHGLSLLHKLSLEHIQLTSYSRMRVDLAAQVLSGSVANALAFYGRSDTKETERFVRFFDKFFDCLNVRGLDEHIKKRKPDLAPYRSLGDKRLTWLKDDFLNYLDEWESSVRGRKKFTNAQKAMMTLSRETREGLRMTVNSFVEVVSYLLSLHNVVGQFILSEHFSQDPLENYFGRQRAIGGRCDNPTFSSCLQAAQSLRVQKSLALQPVRGNCSRKRKLFRDKQEVDDTPLTKRPRHKTK